MLWICGLWIHGLWVWASAESSSELRYIVLYQTSWKKQERYSFTRTFSFQRRWSCLFCNFKNLHVLYWVIKCFKEISGLKSHSSRVSQYVQNNLKCKQFSLWHYKMFFCYFSDMMKHRLSPYLRENEQIFLQCWVQCSNSEILVVWDLTIMSFYAILAEK